jgi:anti-sigma-K factor RskA
MRGNIKEGTTFAISVEPFGGSPTGQATGPVIAVGTARWG